MTKQDQSKHEKATPAAHKKSFADLVVKVLDWLRNNGYADVAERLTKGKRQTAG